VFSRSAATRVGPPFRYAAQPRSGGAAWYRVIADQAFALVSIFGRYQGGLAVPVRSAVAQRCSDQGSARRWRGFTFIFSFTVYQGSGAAV